MLQVDGDIAFKTVLKKKSARLPDINDPRYKVSPLKKSAFFLPHTSPRFGISPGDRVFAIGSCFAREVEKVLTRLGCRTPVAEFTDARPELSMPLLEFTPASICQRILSAYGRFTYGEGVGIEKIGDNWVDHCLKGGGSSSSLDKIYEARAAINTLYGELRTADVLVITLGMIESWYDAEYDCYLNNVPSFYEAKKHPKKYVFRRLDYDDSLALVDTAVKCAIEGGTKKIILTVSPVALDTSFMPDDTVVANSYSKSVLRCVAEVMRHRYSEVDYFPSYEVAVSFGLSGTIEDNSHIHQFVIDQIMELMKETYFQEADPV